MGWTTAWIVTGDGVAPEECASETEAIIRAGSRLDARVVRVQQGDQFATLQTVWPELGAEITCRRGTLDVATCRNACR